MPEIIDLRTVDLEMNSPLWQVSELEGETVLQVTGNLATTDRIGTAAYLDEDHVGKVVLIGQVKHNYRMQADMIFLGHHHPGRVPGGSDSLYGPRIV